MNHTVHSMNTNYAGAIQPVLFALSKRASYSYSAVDFV